MKVLISMQANANAVKYLVDYFILSTRRVHFQLQGCLVTFVLIIYCRNPVFTVKGVVPGQTPYSAASELGLHRLQRCCTLDGTCE